MHYCQRRVLWRVLKFWFVVLSALFAWGYLIYDGFNTL